LGSPMCEPQQAIDAWFFTICKIFCLLLEIFVSKI
jgi:hypothetical protein